ncbi:aminodeoxychorismate/anthranilate synthase component II [Staphylococcus croceilyticus]|uniref:Aminodeoxychorismate/anthranilate synthase component II n=1 Tax=Staphylococcus croceilyticus TaxID=319942 RepID=A0ABY2KCV8_9STAP|nr:aminodeoxychorismate/anthranilate synthase component II [Staphylococcus croceilyticus]PNZ68700.1 aminodeoxychorismate/anthranilate synthase component II [Staphylococcus croceilyticus]TGA79453.1 aminodeoxychorismate/anthranilate synthase component II [Staphylococcus croceilyticus]
MIVVIDNKDSFTYNLIDYIKTETTLSLQVYEVDDVSMDKLSQLHIDAIVISPGPGKPSDYPILREVMQHYEGEIPILGVCLGFQFIFEYYGGRIIHGAKPIHGHTTRLKHSGTGIFKDLPQQFEVMRYHSLIANKTTLPSQLQITAHNEEGIPMAIEHSSLPIYAVQYHPESILSEYGHEQLRHFLSKVGLVNEYHI